MLSPRLLISIDNMIRPLYWLSLMLFLTFRKKKAAPATSDKTVYAIKMMGLGSITRIYRTLKAAGVDFDKVLFISLSGNRALFEALGVKNVRYVRGGNLFLLVKDLVQLFFFIRKSVPSSLINYERASNFLGLYQILSVAFTKTAAFSYHDLKTDHIGQKDRIYSLNNRPFQQLIDLSLTQYHVSVNPASPVFSQVDINARKIIVNINASDYMPYRKYSIEQFAEVIRGLHHWNPSLHFDLIGARHEQEYVDR